MNNGRQQQHLPKLKLRQRTRTCSSDSGVEVTFCTNTQSLPCPPIFSTLSRQEANLDEDILWTSPFLVLKILKWFRPFFILTICSGWQRVSPRPVGGHTQLLDGQDRRGRRSRGDYLFFVDICGRSRGDFVFQ